MKVQQDAPGPQIILSRAHPDFVVNLFKTEVPEISEGIITIKAVVREPGARTKIAVVSNDVDIDPVGACVGVRGSRIQNVVKELRGEKIDIVSWNIDPAKFVCNALSPAQISRVIIDEEDKSMEVIVSDDTHSQAIGRRGQNVKLASKLTGWHLDVVGEEIYNKTMEKGYGSLLKIPGVDEQIATAMCEMGFFSAEEVSNAGVEDLIEVEGIDEETAAVLIEQASQVAEQVKIDEAEASLEEKAEASPEEDAEASLEEKAEASPEEDAEASSEEKAEASPEEDAEASSEEDNAPDTDEAGEQPDAESDENDQETTE